MNRDTRQQISQHVCDVRSHRISVESQLSGLKFTYSGYTRNYFLYHAAEPQVPDLGTPARASFVSIGIMAWTVTVQQALPQESLV